MFLKAGTWRYTGSCCHSNAFPCVMELLYDFAFKHFLSFKSRAQLHKTRAQLHKNPCTIAQKPCTIAQKPCAKRKNMRLRVQSLSARKSSKGRRLRHLFSMSITKVLLI